MKKKTSNYKVASSRLVTLTYQRWTSEEFLQFFEDNREWLTINFEKHTNVSNRYVIHLYWVGVGEGIIY
ncbi:hypothetical protein [Mycoplasmopsis fermentans]|uniref:hypothetical protein n=1 Tax=Mycoplasmopsis fermentans TaxID=2115 RepID=UPI0003059541|nr:hypothetical protein [Mycoplasmopsis fermentans]